MWPSVISMMIVSGWVWVLPAAVSADPENRMYKKVGDKVVLQPGSAYVSGTSITWRHDGNMASEWDGTEIECYLRFKVRASLNNSSGEMTITGLTREDSGLYEPELDNGVGSQTRLIVISPVPTPTVLKSCDDEKSICTLTCDGNTTGAEPVTYKWKLDDKVSTDPSKEHRITKEDSSSMKEFSCELENPVSQKSSQPISNPFTTTAPDDTEPGNLKISAGLTVFITLVVVVLLLVLFHRWKAGSWFYQKESMPWEADFWRTHERPRRDAAESNGTTSHQEKMGEETPMT